MAAVRPGLYRLVWEPHRLCWVLWNGGWELGSMTGFPPGRPQVHQAAAREWAGFLVGPLDWQPDGTARPAA